MENHEKWYGNIGIDTPYERSLIRYRPNLIYPERESNYPLDQELVIRVSRAQDFMISKALLDYRALAERIRELLDILEKRTPKFVFQKYITALQKKDLARVFEIEEEEAGYDGVLDLELYTMLYIMLESVEGQTGFLDEQFRTQITNETEDEKVIEAEGQSINNWIRTEYDLKAAYDELIHGDEEEHHHVEDKIERLEDKRRNLDLFHTSMGDVAYIHRNRYLMLEEIVQEADVLIHHPQALIDGNIRVLLMQLSELEDKDGAKAHLILTFKNNKTKHSSLKQQYMMIGINKEHIASEREYMYQQLTINVNDNIRDWLYEQPENSGRSLDLFAEIMVDAVEDSKRKYEKSLADMLGFYQSESSFYGRQMTLIRKKEEIRRFLRILEDLEETNEVSDEWIDTYLRTEGYET